MKKWLRIGGVLAGGVLATYLLRQVGWTSIHATLAMLKWKFVVVLVYPLSWILLNTAGFQRVIRRERTSPVFHRLAEIRLAGETFNSLLPSGYVGGEPLKAKLLAHAMSLREAASAVLVAKAAQSVALVVFLALGLTLAHGTGGPTAHGHAVWVALGILSISILIFTQLLARRSFSRLGKLLHHMTQSAWLKERESKFVALDETLETFFAKRKGSFFASIGWHGLGWLAGALELWVIFFLLGHSLTWNQAWFMGAMAQLAAVIGLIAPAGVGFYEGGHYMAARVLGLSPALAVSVSLIRRIRELFWDMVGVILFWKLTKEQPLTARSEGARGEESKREPVAYAQSPGK